MDPTVILEEIAEYHRKSGLKVSTICQMAFRNSKYFDRLSARVERLKLEQMRFADFVVSNPPKPAASAAPTNEQPHEPTSQA